VQDPNDNGRPRLQSRGHGFGRRAPGLFTRIAAVVGGVLVLAGAVAISFVVFVAVAAVVVIVGLYLWWKTRHLRKQLRAQMQEQMNAQAPPGEQRRGEVLEGEFVRKDDPPDARP
jgi:membrane protein implicated in regulation of membrane protease activity